MTLGTLLNKVKMNIRGHMNPSVDYFAEHCEAPTDTVKAEISEAKSFAAAMYENTRKVTRGAAHIDGALENGLFTAKTTIFYDPSTLSSSPEPFSEEAIFEHMLSQNRDEEIISYQPANTYEGGFYHTEKTISIPHRMITDQPTDLPKEKPRKQLIRGLHGFPTASNTITKNDYHS